MEWAYAFGVLIALATLIFGALGLRGRSRKDYVDLLQAEVHDLRVKLTDRDAEIRRLRDENDWLRRRLMERE